jgi:hypothetical protein
MAGIQSADGIFFYGLLSILHDPSRLTTFALVISRLSALYERNSWICFGKN